MKRLGIALLAAGVSACSSATAPTAERPFDLFINHLVDVDATPWTVRFDSVIEDSRCPTGAMCVWAGRAEVQLTMTHPDGPDDLHQARLVDRPDSNTALVEGWFVEFVDLLPRPAINQPPDPNARRVRLIVRQALD